MLVIFGVVAAVEGPGAIAELAVDIAGFVQSFVLAHDQHLGLDIVFYVTGGLPHEAPDHLLMVLAEHGGHGIPLGTKIEEGEEVVLLPHRAHMHLGSIDGGDLVFVRTGFQLEAGKGETVVVVQAFLRIGIHRIAVVHHIADIHAVGGQGHIVTVGGRAHGEEVAAPGHVFADLFGHGKLALRYFIETQFACRFLGGPLVFAVPLEIFIAGPELAVLPGKILVVQVQPVVHGQNTVQHFGVVDHIIGNLGIAQHQGHGIVPGLLVLGRIHGDLRRDMQFDLVHVHLRLCDLLQYGRGLHIGDHLAAHPADHAFVLDQLMVGTHKTSAPVIQQPAHLHLLIQYPVGHPVCFQMVLLRIVHWNEKVSSAGRQSTEHERKCQ